MRVWRMTCVLSEQMMVAKLEEIMMSVEDSRKVAVTADEPNNPEVSEIWAIATTSDRKRDRKAPTECSTWAEADPRVVPAPDPSME